MTEQPEPAEDARVLDDLRRALGPDPLPPGLLARAASLGELLDLEHDLAALLDEAPELAGSRGDDDGRLSFASADGLVALEVASGPSRLSGQLLSGDAVEVGLEVRRGSPAAAVPDELGRFAFPLPPGGAGPVRLRLRRAGGGRDVVTDWFLS